MLHGILELFEGTKLNRHAIIHAPYLLGYAKNNFFVITEPHFVEVLSVLAGNLIFIYGISLNNPNMVKLAKKYELMGIHVMEDDSAQIDGFEFHHRFVVPCAKNFFLKYLVDVLLFRRSFVVERTLVQISDF
jgi:hypothetical protein